jgi:peptidoglycan/xylan/chitin deacetylase (PgdA/CDA1 family)
VREAGLEPLVELDPPAESAGGRLESARASALCDWFRIPYGRLAGGPGPLPELRWTGPDGRTRSLLHAPVEGGEGRSGEFRLGDVPFFGRVVSDATAADRLRETGASWRPTDTIRDGAGTAVGSIWRDEHGSVFLPFDPDQVLQDFWSEGYQSLGGGSAAATARTAARRLYYRLKPVLPRAVQLALRRAFRPLQGRARFPRWPVETALHDFCDTVLALLVEVAGEPLPCIAPWPRGRRWALVLTHDVEHAGGLERIGLLRDIELAAGVRSSWNLVPERYETGDAIVGELTAAGFEVGVHGLRHDGLDLDSEARLRGRLPAIRGYAERWGAQGFRAPALHRRWEWMPLLGFDYDSSYPDTDPYEPMPGGCCSWLPFFNGDMVELPVTLAQDHTIFVLLGEQDGRLWHEKTDILAARGGMACLITHPDYMLDEQRLAAYRRFVEDYGSDPAVWCALPREVSAWWRARAASTPELVDGEWKVTGPAAGDATVDFIGGSR